MGELMYRTGDLLLSTAIRRMLTGAGLTLVGGGVSIAVLDGLIARLEFELSSVPQLALALMDLSATDVAISYILSAIVSRNIMNRAMVHLARA